MKLIFHIGAGKTGSTSIQRTLTLNDTLLKERGVWYLGLRLERASAKLFKWQETHSAIQDFYRLSNDEAKKQLLEVFRPITEEAKEKNIETLIWSNESFLGRNHNFTGALQQLQKEGVEVEILIYVREYASWAYSAYLQWGIKHKTYLGKLQTFTEWSKTHPPSFYKQMKNLLEIMPERVSVRNMSAIEDVVLDFLDFANIESEGIEISHSNQTPKNEELFLRALFNSKIDARVLPERFNNILGKDIHFSVRPKEFLDELLPTDDDLKSVLRETAYDQEEINSILLTQGQKKLEEKKYSAKSTDIDTEKLLMSLADIVMDQSKRIDNLERLSKKNKVIDGK